MAAVWFSWSFIWIGKLVDTTMSFSAVLWLQHTRLQNPNNREQTQIIKVMPYTTWILNNIGTGGTI